LAKLREAKKNVNTADSWIGERDFAKSYEEYKRLFMRLKIDAMMQLD